MKDAVVRFPLHFDIDQSELSTPDYITALKAVDVIISDLDLRLFNGLLEVELLSVGDETGTFKGILRIAVKGGKGALAAVLFLAAINQTLETEFAQGFIEGLTGKKPDFNEIGEDVGSFLREMTIEILSTQTEVLELKIPAELNFDKSLKAKSDFFEMCLRNNTIKAVGFSEAEDFPIQRKDFVKHIVKDRERQLPSKFSLHDAIVVSPVDTGVRQVWRFRDRKTGKPLSGYMEDEDFKKAFLNGKYPMKQTSADDIMTITLEHRLREKNGVIQRYETCVHTVHKLNGTQFKPIDSHIFMAGYRPSQAHGLFG